MIKKVGQFAPGAEAISKIFILKFKIDYGKFPFVSLFTAFQLRLILSG